MINEITKILLKPAKMDDVTKLVAVENSCFIKYYRAHRFTREQFSYYIKNPFATTVIAIKNGNIVGYILGLNQRGRLKDIAKLYSIAVLPNERNKGIGKRLLKNFIKIAKKQGANRITLEVAEKNPKAKKLFNDCAFQQTRSMKNYYGKGINGIRMENLL